MASLENPPKNFINTWLSPLYLWLVSLVAKVNLSDAAQAITDPGNAGAIPVTVSGVCKMASGASGETRTLANPTFVGQRINLVLGTDGGGDAVVTVASAINQTGNNTITFNDAGDQVELVGVQIATSTMRWRLVVNNGATLSTV